MAIDVFLTGSNPNRASYSIIDAGPRDEVMAKVNGAVISALTHREEGGLNALDEKLLNQLEDARDRLDDIVSEDGPNDLISVNMVGEFSDEPGGDYKEMNHFFLSVRKVT